jgi:hypothetical protein
MTGGLEFLFWSLVCAIGLGAWGVCEIVEARRKVRRRNRYLPRPAYDARRLNSREFAGR